jgi:hypothetical protein
MASRAMSAQADLEMNRRWAIEMVLKHGRETDKGRPENRAEELLAYVLKGNPLFEDRERRR